MRIALVTNIPPPYRIPIFNRLGQWDGIDFHGIFCSSREPNRDWDLPTIQFERHWLRENFLTVRGRYVHHNMDVIPLLGRLRPDVVITDGFNPTHLYSFMIARLQQAHPVAMTDGTWESERSLSLIHRLVRRYVYRRTHAFIAASEGGKRLFRSYGAPSESCFFSWLCVDNQAFAPEATRNRPFDFIFCGRMEPEKDPLFALAVASDCAAKLGRTVRLLIVGSGSLDAVVRQAAADTRGVDVTLHGFAKQAELPGLYQSARVFLFPSHGDVWGIVANEACAAGLPVLSSPHAGVAGELVIEGRNGFIRDLRVQPWSECAQRLLSDDLLWETFSNESLRRVKQYNFDSAARGIVDACHFAVSGARAVQTSRLGERL